MITPPYARRWRLPPPYLREPEPLEGAGILEEFAGALGLLLWQSVRDAGLWALTPPDRRDGLFNEEAEPRRLAELLSIGEPVLAIEEPLRALAAMLSHPADVAPEAVMLACNRVSQWAESGHAIGTALAYAQGSALAVPASSRSALRVGRLARRRGEHARAEGWLQRAIVLARQEEDRVTHASAYTALGTLYHIRGNLPAAERHHLRSLRIATRHSLIAREAAAVHDLFVIYAATSRFEEAVAYARRAVTAYGPKDERLPALAHDVAVLWLDNGEFARALRVLLEIWPRVAPSDRVVALANAARAAGSLRDSRVYEDCRTRVMDMLATAETPEHHSVVILNLARGAVGLGELDLAEDLASRARDLADQAQEHKISFGVQDLLQQIASERAAGGASERESAPPRVTTSADECADALVDELVACFAS